ncbi:MAG: BTAD domain-containing putative transcriptional regulator [Deinococcales bacterium]
MSAYTPRPGTDGAVRNPWQLHLLGETAELVGPTGRWRPARVASLILAFLALEGPTPRERLAGLLWPERPESRARANLRQALLRIDQHAPVLDRDGVALREDLWADVRHMDSDDLAAIAPAGLLGSLDASDLPELESWLEASRSDVTERQAAALTASIESATSEGDLAAAVLAAVKLVRLRPWSEDACRTLMELELARGEPGAALRAYARLRRALAEEVGAAPTAATQALARGAARAAAGALQTELPSLTAMGGPLAHSAETGGWMEEGASLLQSVVAALTEPHELARALVDLAWLEHRLGRNAAAERRATRALELLAQGQETSSTVAEAHFVRGSLSWARGDLDGARSRWGEALKHLEQSDAFAELRMRLDLALVEDALGRGRQATGHYLRALALARATGERMTEANVLNNLGLQMAVEGRARDGVRLLERALALARLARDRLLEGYVLDSLAQARLQLPERHRAGLLTPTQAAATAFTIATETGDKRLQIESLLTLARAELGAGRRARAETCARAALRRADAVGWEPLVEASRRLLRDGTGAQGRDAAVTGDGPG